MRLGQYVNTGCLMESIKDYLEINNEYTLSDLPKKKVKEFKGEVHYCIELLVAPNKLTDVKLFIYDNGIKDKELIKDKYINYHEKLLIIENGNMHEVPIKILADSFGIERFKKRIKRISETNKIQKISDHEYLLYLNLYG